MNGLWSYSCPDETLAVTHFTCGYEPEHFQAIAMIEHLPASHVSVLLSPLTKKEVDQYKLRLSRMEKVYGEMNYVYEIQCGAATKSTLTYDASLQSVKISLEQV